VADKQRFRIAPVTMATFGRFFGVFPVLRVVIPVPFLLIALGVA